MDVQLSLREFLLFIAGFFALCAAIYGIGQLLLRLFRLTIPKAKIFDDKYIDNTLRRVRKLRRVCLYILIAQLIAAAALAVIYFTGVVDLFSPKLSYWTWGFIALIYCNAPFIRQRGSVRSYLNADDLTRKLDSARAQENQTKGQQL